MKIWGRKDEVSFAEEVIGRFFQPLKGVKISLMIIASFGLLLLFLSLGLNLYPHLPNGFPASLFLSLLIFLGGLTSAVILYAIDKAKIGHWFVITNKGIRKGRKYLLWEKIRTISYLSLNLVGKRPLYGVYRLPPGVYLSAIPPQEVREMVSKSSSVRGPRKGILSNCLVIPFDTEDLPKLIGLVFKFAPSVIYDAESFLVSQLREGESFIVDPSDLFQACIYKGESALPWLRDFSLGIGYLLKLDFQKAERYFERAQEYEEIRVRPYLVVSLFLQGKYKECISILENAPSALNDGEWMILLSSLARLGEWEKLEQKLERVGDDTSKFFHLGVLCANGKWKELMSEVETMGRKEDPSLNLCYKCAEQLLGGPPASISQVALVSEKSSNRYYFYFLLVMLLSVVFSFLKGLARGFGILLIMFSSLIEWLLGKPMREEAYTLWSLLVQRKLASPFWCTFAFLATTGKEGKSSKKRKLPL